MAFTEGVALISAFKKDEALRDFARGLQRLDWTIWASAGTKKFFDEHNIRSLDIGHLVGEPILGHRVVTLDRRVYAALLSRDDEEDEKELERLDISRIDLVYVSLYPLQEELEKQASNPVSVAEAYAQALEKVDIGGPTLLRAAAKGGRWVVPEPRFFVPMLEQLEGDQTEDSTKLRHTFAFMAEIAVADYAKATAKFYESIVLGTFPEAFKK